jgi:gluconate 2-dehydrogenase gamma chain
LGKERKMTEDVSRRGFLKVVASGTALLVLKGVEEGVGLSGVRASETTSSQHKFFDEHQWATVEALTAQVIPTDQYPGAREAGVVNYIDIALATVYSAQQEMYVQGIKGVDQSAKAMFKKDRFIDLTSQQQVEMMKAMEQDKAPGEVWKELPASSFLYDCLLTHTFEGFYSDPSYGGNKNHVGWALVGFPGPSQPRGYAPPFTRATEE